MKPKYNKYLPTPDPDRGVTDAVTELKSVLHDLIQATPRELQDMTDRIGDAFRKALTSDEPNSFDVFRQEYNEVLTHITFKPVLERKLMIITALNTAARVCKALLVR